MGRSIGGPVGDRLARTAVEIRLGGEPADSWGRFGEVPGAGPLARCLYRAGSTGAPAADPIARLAASIRAERAAAAVARAQRAGVLITAPVGLCFLPAFLAVGVAPVIIGWPATCSRPADRAGEAVHGPWPTVADGCRQMPTNADRPFCRSFNFAVSQGCSVRAPARHRCSSGDEMETKFWDRAAGALRGGRLFTGRRLGGRSGPRGGRVGSAGPIGDDHLRVRGGNDRGVCLRGGALLRW